MTTYTITIINQNKKTIISAEFTGSLESAMNKAQAQYELALTVLGAESATAFVWNNEISGFDAMLDENGWDL